MSSLYGQLNLIKFGSRTFRMRNMTILSSFSIETIHNTKIPTLIIATEMKYSYQFQDIPIRFYHQYTAFNIPRNATHGNILTFNKLLVSTVPSSFGLLQKLGSRNKIV